MANQSYEQIIANIEQLLRDAKPMRMNGLVRVDPHQIQDQLDLLRQNIPDEIIQARRVINDRKRLMASAQAASDKAVEDANARASQIIAEAQSRASAMVEDTAIVRDAQSRANELSAAAAADTANLRAQAQDYKDQIEAQANKYYGDTMQKAQYDSAQLRLDASNYCKQIIKGFRLQIGDSINYFSGVSASLDGSEQRLDSYIARFENEMTNLAGAVQQSEETSDA